MSKAATTALADQAWKLNQALAHKDYLGESEQVERDLGDLALIVSELAERVAALESNQDDAPASRQEGR